MKDKPDLLVSIIVPSMNQGRFLRGCIDSILAQDYRPLEIIVVDGASTDETVEVLQQCGDIPELRWISEPDSGPADAVNKGLSMAKGGIGGIQSVDDYYLPGAVDLAVEHFLAEPGLGFLYGEVRRIGPNDEYLSTSSRPPHTNELCLALCMCVPQSSCFFDLRLANTIGGWNEKYFTCDWEFWLRMMFRAPARKIDSVLSVRRIYPNQRTGQRSVVLESVIRMLKESPDVAGGGYSIRRAAVVSRFMANYFFAASPNRLQRAVYLLAATLLMPSVLRYVLINKPGNDAQIGKGQ